MHQCLQYECVELVHQMSHVIGQRDHVIHQKYHVTSSASHMTHSPVLYQKKPRRVRRNCNWMDMQMADK